MEAADCRAEFSVGLLLVDEHPFEGFVDAVEDLEDCVGIF